MSVIEEAAVGPRSFPACPPCWYHLGRRGALGRPIGLTIPSGRVVGFIGGGGTPAVLEARCAHLGADLSRGAVVGGRIQCPLHGWEYGADGRCGRIPACSEIPAFASCAAYPVAEVGGEVFFFNRPRAAFEMPFYEGVRPDELLTARAFELDADVPWYLVGANGFDAQHFQSAHDRALVGDYVVDCPTPCSRRIRATFSVAGESLRDRLTRCFSGADVTMTVHVYAGALVLVTARFRRTTSYGLVSVYPTGAFTSRLRTIVWVPRSPAWRGGVVADVVDAFVRRAFIRAFVQSDVDRSAGIRYNPRALIGPDRELRAYMAWLAQVCADMDEGSRAIT